MLHIRETIPLVSPARSDCCPVVACPAISPDATQPARRACRARTRRGPNCGRPSNAAPLVQGTLLVPASAACRRLAAAQCRTAWPRPGARLWRQSLRNAAAEAFSSRTPLEAILLSPGPGLSRVGRLAVGSGVGARQPARAGDLGVSKTPLRSGAAAGKSTAIAFARALARGSPMFRSREASVLSTNRKEQKVEADLSPGPPVRCNRLGTSLHDSTLGSALLLASLQPPRNPAGRSLDRCATFRRG